MSSSDQDPVVSVTRAASSCHGSDTHRPTRLRRSKFADDKPGSQPKVVAPLALRAECGGLLPPPDPLRRERVSLRTQGMIGSVVDDTVTERLCRFALALPEAWEDHPWGNPVVKVGKKIFAFLADHEVRSVTVKLNESHLSAMGVPGSTPTRYGLGRAGWVTVPLDGPDTPPAEVIEDWIDESYRLVAPRRLVRELDEQAGSDR